MKPPTLPAPTIANLLKLDMIRVGGWVDEEGVEHTLMRRAE